MSMVSDVPMWILTVAEEFSSSTALNVVVLAIRSSSAHSSVYSSFMIVRCVVEYEPVAACSASSFMRMRISLMTPIAPSAV